MKKIKKKVLSFASNHPVATASMFLIAAYGLGSATGWLLCKEHNKKVISSICDIWVNSDKFLVCNIGAAGQNSVIKALIKSNLVTEESIRKWMNDEGGRDATIDIFVNDDYTKKIIEQLYENQPVIEFSYT